jgi:hypothetical protein
VPRKATSDDEPPRRRRHAVVTVAEVAIERGLLLSLLLRVLLYSPKDMVAGLLAFAATSAIIANALFLQTGPHPAPMFGSVVMIPQASSTVASPLPRPRPADADALFSESRLAETRISEPRLPESRVVEPRPVESKPTEFRTAEPKTAEPKAADPLTNLVKATGAGPTASLNVLRPPAPIPPAPGPTVGSRRVAAVQRALTEYGYGQLKPTGTIGPETQAAIQKFERERRIPVTGQLSDRLVHELAAAIGHPVD